jgi:amino acid permease
MPRSVDSSEGSIISVLTSSSRASQAEAYHTEPEVEKSGSRMTRRTVSDSGHRSDQEPGRNTPQPNRDNVRRKREFKGRHIQMFGIGISQLLL